MNDNRIKSVTLNFENCEYVEIPCKYFGVFSVRDFHREIYRVASNCVKSNVIADSVVCEIFPEANADNIFNFCNENELLFSRIRAYDDIVSLGLKYEDGRFEEIMVDYDTGDNDALGADNLNQSSFVSSFGVLYLVIDSNSKASVVFDDVTVADGESLRFRKNMAFDVSDHQSVVLPDDSIVISVSKNVDSGVSFREIVVDGVRIRIDYCS